MSRVVTLGERLGAIPKKVSIDGKDNDGQHINENNCGCHQCITELATVRMEKLITGKEPSIKFREQVKEKENI